MKLKQFVATSALALSLLSGTAMAGSPSPHVIVLGTNNISPAQGFTCFKTLPGASSVPQQSEGGTEIIYPGRRFHVPASPEQKSIGYQEAKDIIVASLDPSLRSNFKNFAPQLPNLSLIQLSDDQSVYAIVVMSTTSSYIAPKSGCDSNELSNPVLIVVKSPSGWLPVLSYTIL